MAEETDFWGVSVSRGCQGIFCHRRIRDVDVMVQLNWYRQTRGCLCSVVASMLSHMMWGGDFIIFFNIRRIFFVLPRKLHGTHPIRDDRKQSCSKFVPNSFHIEHFEQFGAIWSMVIWAFGPKNEWVP